MIIQSATTKALLLSQITDIGGMVWENRDSGDTIAHPGMHLSSLNQRKRVNRAPLEWDLSPPIRVGV